MKKILFSSLVFLMLFSISTPVLAGTITIPNPLCPDPADPDNCIQNLPQLIAKITQYVSAIVGTLATLMFLWAGILFVTSGGNEGRLGQAKKAALYAAIGTAIALAGAGLVAVINAVINP